MNQHFDCLFYYFYFIDKNLGLCYLRVPTWAPFRLQLYCNAHKWVSVGFKVSIEFILSEYIFVSYLKVRCQKKILTLMQRPW